MNRADRISCEVRQDVCSSHKNVKGAHGENAMPNERILIVEDNRTCARSLAIKCEGLGYEVPRPCSSGEDAIKFAEREPFDLAMMDIRLGPGIDGRAGPVCLNSGSHSLSGFLLLIENRSSLPTAYPDPQKPRSGLHEARALYAARATAGSPA